VTRDTEEAPQAVSTLDTRYGRTPLNGRVPRWVPVAVVTAVIGLSWLAWAAWNATEQPVNATITAYETVSSGRIDVRLEITRREGVAVRCELYAQAYDHGIVGESVVELPAGDPGTEVVMTSIPTDREAFTAALRGCSIDAP
jgi:hypothetical protein